MSQPTRFKAVFFDFMGTCLDWHTGVVDAFPSSISREDASKIALEWRQQYFVEVNQRFRQALEPEDINNTLGRALEYVLDQKPDFKPLIDSDQKMRLVKAWHSQRAWPEVQDAIRRLREELGLEVFVHANGTTRLQLNLTRSSGLNFNMLFSSQLLGSYKPSPEAYNRALNLVGLRPSEVVMVAAHAYDLRGAQKCGMKTVYIHRWTDDLDEDMEKVRTEFDAFLEDMKDLPATLASI